jgi:outer membrane lipoprotein carrier protein
MFIQNFRFLCFVVMSFFATSIALAQTQEVISDKGQSDAKSQEILKKVSKLYQGYKTITASFTITTSAVNKKPLVSKGTVWIKGNKFKLNYANQEIYCNGSTIWTYNPDDQEVTLEDYKKRDNNITPNEIFTVYIKDIKANMRALQPREPSS